MIGRILDRLRDVRRRKLWSPTAASGRRGEDLAHRFLRGKGFIIVARNFRLAGEAEADLIAREGDALVIVEVKTREDSGFGPPERAIDEEKRRHLIRVARAFARRTETPWERVRFDVVTVVLCDPPKIELYRNAW
ncbi:MAG TPA: YraN family protein [Bryobacteraceae bacterium]|jgi:putative endonuclease|nr:YraN family protein [Bryobacteraceae bacterium]